MPYFPSKSTLCLVAAMSCAPNLVYADSNLQRHLPMASPSAELTQLVMPGPLLNPGRDAPSSINAGVSRLARTPELVSNTSDGCNMTIGSAKLDFGRYNTGSSPNLLADTRIPIGTRTVSLQVTCRQAGQVAIVLNGQAGSDGVHYAFGQSADLTVNAHLAQADGHSARLALVSTPGQIPLEWQDEVTWLPGKTLVIGARNSENFNQANVELIVSANLHSAKIYPIGAISLASALSFIVLQFGK
jgi:hypothetical protein